MRARKYCVDTLRSSGKIFGFSASTCSEALTRSMRSPRLVLVSEIMQRDGHEPVASMRSVLSGEFAAASAKRSASARALPNSSVVELVDAQAPERAQPEILVVEPVGQLEGRLEDRARLARAAFAIHQRPAERRQELHADAIARRGLVERGKRRSCSLAAFGEQRQAHPQRDRDAPSARYRAERRHQARRPSPARHADCPAPRHRCPAIRGSGSDVSASARSNKSRKYSA